jgi:hypothetical protein
MSRSAASQILPVDQVIICAGQEPKRELADPLRAAGKSRASDWRVRCRDGAGCSPRHRPGNETGAGDLTGALRLPGLRVRATWRARLRRWPPAGVSWQSAISASYVPSPLSTPQIYCWWRRWRSYRKFSSACGNNPDGGWPQYTAHR